jgi:hypothetical protein
MCKCATVIKNEVWTYNVVNVYCTKWAGTKKPGITIHSRQMKRNLKYTPAVFAQTYQTRS